MPMQPRPRAETDNPRTSVRVAMRSSLIAAELTILHPLWRPYPEAGLSAEAAPGRFEDHPDSLLMAHPDPDQVAPEEQDQEVATVATPTITRSAARIAVTLAFGPSAGGRAVPREFLI